MEQPSGTVTFLFTDLQVSTRLWDTEPDAMRVALARHDSLLRDAVDAHGGLVVKGRGDGLHAVFATADAAVRAAIASELAMDAEPWSVSEPLRVRIGIHTGVAELRDGDYFGSAVNRAARLEAIAHGGQIVCSQATTDLARDLVVEGVEFVDLGEHRLRDLSRAERVFQVRASGLPATFPPLTSIDAFPGNLPLQLSSFVGRERQVEAITALLSRQRLVTLTGVGGVGKTRLALQVAAEVVSEFPDGAWLCELAPVTDPDAVWETLAGALRVQPLPGRALDESVLEYLAAKRLLMVLDNCEHLLDAAARLVDVIERRCVGVSVLATSREGLGVAGERMVAVPSLGVPVDDATGDELRHAESVRLFWDRAAAAKSDFALTDSNVASVGVLCRRLDGIPLAIELAAARVRSLSAEDLVSRLDQRFKLLTHGSRAALERHQTLRSTIDWSYDLLTPTERLALQRLSVFAGGCDLAAAEAVLAGDELDELDVIEVLGQLVDKSLVVADNDDAAVRYRLLESIRQYARERLDTEGDPAAVRRRHADHYVSLAETAAQRLRGRDHLDASRVVTRDVDNIRTALDWAVEVTSSEHALRLVAPLAVQGRTGELAMDWAATATTIPGGEDHELFPIVAAWAAWGATTRSDYAQAEAFLAMAEQAQDTLAVKHPAVARARATLAFFQSSGFEAGRDHAADWVDLARASGDDYELAHALTMLAGALQMTEPTLDAAIAAIDESVRVARANGIDSALIFGLPMMASWLPDQGSERVEALIDESIDISTRLDDHMGASTGQANKAGLALQRGDWRTALQSALRAAEQKLEAGDLQLIVTCLTPAGIALCSLGSYEAAAVLIGKADAMMDRFGPDWVLEMSAATDAALLDALGEEDVRALADRGAALTVADAVAYLRTEAERVLATQ